MGLALIGAILGALLFAGVAYVTGKDEGRIDPVFAAAAALCAAVAIGILVKSATRPKAPPPPGV